VRHYSNHTNGHLSETDAKEEDLADTLSWFMAMHGGAPQSNAEEFQGVSIDLYSIVVVISSA